MHPLRLSIASASAGQGQAGPGKEAQLSDEKSGRLGLRGQGWSGLRARASLPVLPDVFGTLSTSSGGRSATAMRSRTTPASRLHRRAMSAAQSPLARNPAIFGEGRQSSGASDLEGASFSTGLSRQCMPFSSRMSGSSAKSSASSCAMAKF
jgi:hypothetical protein